MRRIRERTQNWVKSFGFSGAGGGIEPAPGSHNTEVIHSTLRQVTQKPSKRRTEVRGGYAECCSTLEDIARYVCRVGKPATPITVRLVMVN
jgi:hypothetical protein